MWSNHILPTNVISFKISYTTALVKPHIWHTYKNKTWTCLSSRNFLPLSPSLKSPPRCRRSPHPWWKVHQISIIWPNQISIPRGMNIVLCFFFNLSFHIHFLNFLLNMKAACQKLLKSLPAFFLFCNSRSMNSFIVFVSSSTLSLPSQTLTVSSLPFLCSSSSPISKLDLFGRFFFSSLMLKRLDNKFRA